MRVKIISPEKTLYESEGTLLQLPGIDGSFELLVNHAPIISVLKKGVIRLVDKENKELKFEINSGIVECINNNIKILVQ
ncbi:MAG: synthase subunit epsilon [Bacteroidetes bacterium]|nr:synthase subunit epsilon [Bacteroidota bacterium]